MRATCNHVPRRLRATNRVNKDGSSVTYCIDCKADWARRANRKKNGFAERMRCQNGLCAFCGQPLPDDNTVHLDHNHQTSVKRGLVHAHCNHYIGGIEKAIALVGADAMLRYISQ